MRRNVKIALALCIVVLLLCAMTVDAAKKKSAKKSGKGKAAAKEDAKAPGKKAKSFKDWGKMSEQDWARLEDDWMEDETEDPDDEPFKWTRDESGNRRPPDRKGPKTEMGFCTIKGKYKKADTEKLAAKWTEVLQTGGVAARSYAVEDNKVLFVTDVGGFKDMVKVKKFALAQPEVEEFEWNSQKSKPGDADKEIDLEALFKR